MGDTAIQHHRTNSKHSPGKAVDQAPEHNSTDAEIDRKLDSRDERNTALDSAKNFSLFSFDILQTGTKQAIDLLHVPDVPKTDLTKKLLGDLAVAVAGAATGGVSTWVIGALGAAEVLKSAAGDKLKGLVTSALTKALQSGTVEAATQLADLQLSFQWAMNIQYLQAKQRFLGEWPAIKAQLGKLSDSELSTLNALSRNHDTAQAYNEIVRSTLIQWSNFLARAKHGGMKAWDHWETSGPGSKDAVALADAKAAPSSTEGNTDPALGNVDPSKMGWALGKTQRGALDEHFGILEIFLDEHTLRVVGESGYGMRLDNVGPKVREQLRQAGRVGDVPVNKLVRLCSYLHNGVRVDPPISKATILITSDGYVRASHGFDRLHFEPKQGPLWDPTDFGDCMEDLNAGNESKACHIEKEARAASVSAVAEVAQNLSMKYLVV